VATQAQAVDLRYPIGKFQWAGEASDAQHKLRIAAIEAAPANLLAAVAGLKGEQWETPYRPEGWTVRQVVHHVPDSHMNAYIRFKLALTEDEPTIKPYREDRWAELGDKGIDPEISLKLLECVHQRWVAVLKSMRVEDFKKTFRHPELGVMTLEKTLALYAWHGAHHTAHITALRERMGW
jgi:uncharacterized damage-inducible protein DinB